MHALVFAAVALAASPSPTAAPAKTGVAVVAGWSRATPPGAPAAVGFLTVKNDGKADDKLVSASSPWAGQVQIHQMSMEGGVMKMRELKDGLSVKAGTSVALAPGGIHLMLVDLKRPLAAGDSVPVTLVFEKAGAVPVVLAVGALDATGPPGAQVPPSKTGADPGGAR